MCLLIFDSFWAHEQNLSALGNLTVAVISAFSVYCSKYDLHPCQLPKNTTNIGPLKLAFLFLFLSFYFGLFLIHVEWTLAPNKSE